MSSHDTVETALRIARQEGGPLDALRVPHLHPRKLRPPRAFRFQKKLHTGPIHAAVAGRTDHLPIHVPSGSYVLSADLVSGLGEGNTAAGFRHIKRMFAGNPYGGGSNEAPYGQGRTPYGMSTGGQTNDDNNGVPIVAAGGEYVLSPDEVRMAGDGDLDLGHEVLDEFMKRMRAELIKTLKKLPGPRHD